MHFSVIIAVLALVIIVINMVILRACHFFSTIVDGAAVELGVRVVGAPGHDAQSDGAEGRLHDLCHAVAKVGRLAFHQVLQRVDAVPGAVSRVYLCSLLGFLGNLLIKDVLNRQLELLGLLGNLLTKDVRNRLLKLPGVLLEVQRGVLWISSRGDIGYLLAEDAVRSLVDLIGRLLDAERIQFLVEDLHFALGENGHLCPEGDLVQLAAEEGAEEVLLALGDRFKLLLAVRPTPGHAR